MIGPRVGLRVGPRVGLAAGVSADELGSSGFAPVAPGPGLVFTVGSSNPQGPNVATTFTDYPGINAAFASFQQSRMGATLAGAGGGAWVTEAKQDLQPRTTGIDATYVVGTAAWELKMGRDLDALNPGLWGGATLTVDGALLHTLQHFLNPGWPTAGGQWLVRLFAAIDAAIIAHGKPLKVLIWGHGNDANNGPASVAYYTNLITVFSLIRQRYGNIGIVIERLTNRNTAGATVLVRTAMESVAMRPENTRVRVVYTDEVAMLDTAHYGPDAGGALGVCEVGKRMAVAVASAAADTFDLTSPFWGAQGDIQIAGSGALAPIPFPDYYGTFNGKADLGILWYVANSANAIVAPSGWTQVTGSPVWAGAVADARLHVFTRVLQPGDVAPSIADVAADDGKCAGICVIRNTSGLDVNPTTATVAAAAASATVTFPSITPVTPGCLILLIGGHGIDAAVPQIGGLANAGLTNLFKHVDFDTVQGLGYGCVIGAGVRVAATATGTTGGTLLAADTQALMTIALKP